MSALYELACLGCGFAYATESPEATDGRCPTCVREDDERPAFDANDPEITKRFGRATAASAATPARAETPDSPEKESRIMEGNGSFWDEVEGTGYLKAGFLGFPKSGKTFTSVLLAIAVRERFGLKGPISFFDTEGGSTYIRELVKQFTGAYPLVKRSRSFDDLLSWGKESLEAGASVGIADSITHPWRELCDSYLAQKNAARIAAGKKPVTRLEFADWNVIKPAWAVWTDFYLNSPLHLAINGRAGWEYEMEMNEETQKKELIKTGVKMKTEGEFGFEPSLLIEMEREQDRTGDAPRIVRRATVLGDRFNVIDGQTFTFESVSDPRRALALVVAAFGPHLERLSPGIHAPIDTAAKTGFNIDDSGDTEFYRERRERTILQEEIQAELVRAYPGQSAADKKAKADLIREAFNTGSWTKVETLDARALRAGLEMIRKSIAAPRETAEVPAVANA